MKPFQAQPDIGGSANDRALILGFLGFNALFRFLFIGQNGGEYTDGILQIIQFERPDSFWPPLYTALVWAVRALNIEPIMAGRLVSWAASVLLVLPLWSVARAWAGRRAALFTLALYTVSPLALRWGVRVMTDMPFLLFFHLACAALLSFAAGEKKNPGEPAQARHLARATIWAALASLTRYQGLLLVPLIAWGLARVWRAKTPGRGWATGLQALWLTLPAWLLYQHFGLHLEQVAERRGADAWSALLHYWNLFEMFIFIAPYAFTPPVFMFLLVGVIRGPGESGENAGMPLRRLLLYIALVILAAQSVFQSFLTRYLLPLLPLALVCAGAGMARMEAYFSAPQENGTRRPGAQWLPHALVGITVVWSLIFALASFFLQRESFADLYAAGRFIREMNLPEDIRVYSNESYKPDMNGIKLAFAAGRPVALIPELAVPETAAGASRRRATGREPEIPEHTRMEPGSIVAIHTAYGGIQNTQRFLIPFLQRRYQLQPIPGGYFESAIVPLLPDIMQEPGTHQNPLAWGLRYQKQHFQTRLFQVQ